jgi:lysophospholipase L1-like esterase
MIDFSKMSSFAIPEGEVVKIEVDGVVIWQRYAHRYISLGDSIAAGHSINDDWANNYGERTQYGVNGNKSTVIVPNSYTDLIHKDLSGEYNNSVSTKSFARSGDKISDLLNKLRANNGNNPVANLIRNANLVTICIGANDILSHVYPEIMPYIETGDLSSLESNVEASLLAVKTDSNANSYTALFNELNNINPKAKYVFTTVYNPYKYLWIEEGRNGFFKPVIDTIPDWVIDVDKIIEDMFLGGTDLSYYDLTKFEWVSIELDLHIGDFIKDSLLGVPIVQQLFDRVNGLGDWVEKYIEGTNNFDGLNRILKQKISSYQNPNFVVADTKALFDTYPDRTPNIAGDIEYNDLVNVEFTRGYTTGTMDWGALWRDKYGDDYGSYWRDFIWKYLSFSNALPSLNVWDYVSFDMGGFAEKLVEETVNKVIVPNIDPHPETYGQKVLRDAFAEHIN